MHRQNGCHTKVRILQQVSRLLLKNFRRELGELAQTFLYSDSSESSSSDDKDMVTMLFHTVFPPRERVYRTRVCIDDMDECECERLFR